MNVALQNAWQAAVAVTATAYGVDPALVSAPSRGRGPKPPPEIVEPKKVALYLTSMMTGCLYAELGRQVGLHKDTIASHCAELRERCAVDGEIEERVNALALLALRQPGVSAASLLELVTQLAARVERLERWRARHPSILRSHPTPAPDDETVIELRQVAGNRR